MPTYYPYRIASPAFILTAYSRIFNGASCEESLKGLSWSFFAMFSVVFSGILMVSFRSALYKIKAISSNTMSGHLEYFDDDQIGWEEFSKNQPSSFDSEFYPQKESVATQLTFTASDEEYGVEVRRFEANPDEFPVCPTARSNQSSIDTNEYFNDDGVNSHNSELEPLTPSPVSNSKAVGYVGNPAPVAFHFNQKKALSRTSGYSKDDKVRTTPGKPINKRN
jgi:hypothetical protein